jgi:hypothetical protein
VSNCVAAHSVQCKQPLCLCSQANTGHRLANYLDRLPGKCSNSSGGIQVVSGQDPVAASSGIVCQVVNVTQRALPVPDGGTMKSELETTERSRSLDYLSVVLLSETGSGCTVNDLQVAQSTTGFRLVSNRLRAEVCTQACGVGSGGGAGRINGVEGDSV